MWTIRRLFQDVRSPETWIIEWLSEWREILGGATEFF